MLINALHNVNARRDDPRVYDIPEDSTGEFEDLSSLLVVVGQRHVVTKSRLKLEKQAE